MYWYSGMVVPSKVIIFSTCEDIERRKGFICKKDNLASLPVIIQNECRVWIFELCKVIQSKYLGDDKNCDSQQFMLSGEQKNSSHSRSQSLDPFGQCQGSTLTKTIEGLGTRMNSSKKNRITMQNALFD